MKASALLEEIKNELKDFNIEYVRNKVTDDRYKDPLTKKLAKHNSEAYDEIFETEITEDYEIPDQQIANLKSDIDYYFGEYNPHDEENQKLTKNICLFLSFINKKPLHPFGDTPKEDVYEKNGQYFCKGKANYIKEKNSLCKYCCTKVAPFNHFF
ncbi:MAG: DUF2115 family protein [Methanobrevibacter sp.]|uniref:DUF2115 family protein n=1 Tax=Methanobrevibacter sp. TaxID=66852 RepID=UPI0026DFE07F|nr:DUF2115 family protein [Methanobrevibacter sp.]MDO5849503.1 DUF2115 family protein [Methanobrevibacter sp.]